MWRLDASKVETVYHLLLIHYSSLCVSSTAYGTWRNDGSDSTRMMAHCCGSFSRDQWGMSASWTVDYICYRGTLPRLAWQDSFGKPSCVSSSSVYPVYTTRTKSSSVSGSTSPCRVTQSRCHQPCSTEEAISSPDDAVLAAAVNRPWLWESYVDRQSPT